MSQTRRAVPTGQVGTLLRTIEESALHLANILLGSSGDQSSSAPDASPRSGSYGEMDRHEANPDVPRGRGEELPPGGDRPDPEREELELELRKAKARTKHARKRVVAARRTKPRYRRRRK